MNFLEELVAERYEFTGYFVRTNPRARKRAKGGWDMELDVLAYNPQDQELLHVEVSGDANSWTERKKRFMEKKFILTPYEYTTLVGAPVKAIRKIAVVGWTDSTRADLDWGQDVEVVLVSRFIRDIIADLKKRDFMREAVPEGFPLLRAIQLALAFNKDCTTTGSRRRGDPRA